VAPSDRFKTGAEALAFWKRAAPVPAVTRAQVHVWPDDSLATHGPSLPSAIRRFGGLIQGAAER